MVPYHGDTHTHTERDNDGGQSSSEQVIHFHKSLRDFLVESFERIKVAITMAITTTAMK